MFNWHYMFSVIAIIVVFRKIELLTICIFLTVCRFQRASVQDYQLSVGDLGVLQTLRVEHDNTGFAPAWLLNKVHPKECDSSFLNHACIHWLLIACGIPLYTQIEVTSSVASREVIVFPCGQWLATNLGDGSLWRVLSPSKENQQSLSREPHCF